MARTGTPNIRGHEHIVVDYDPRYEDDLYPWIRRETGSRWHRADIRDITPAPASEEG